MLTPTYAAALGLLMAVLSIRVPIRRGALNVPYGDGDDVALATRIRAFGNFTEYVPMVLILMLLAELRGGTPAVLHGIGVTLCIARLMHALLYRGKRELNLREKIGRAVAAMTTWLALVGSAGYLLVLAL